MFHYNVTLCLEYLISLGWKKMDKLLHYGWVGRTTMWFGLSKEKFCIKCWQYSTQFTQLQNNYSQWSELSPSCPRMTKFARDWGSSAIWSTIKHGLTTTMWRGRVTTYYPATLTDHLSIRDTLIWAVLGSKRSLRSAVQWHLSYDYFSFFGNQKTPLVNLFYCGEGVWLWGGGGYKVNV